jgi:D-alanyl-D-alanine carboxypeptidase
MILQLVEEKKLKLQDHLDKFFPQIANANKITIEQVLAHRSGLHDITEDQAFRAYRFKTITKDEVVSMIAKAASDFEPGSKYAYSNSGFYILGMIVEKLTRKTYEENLQTRINSKLGLNNTYVAAGNIDVAKNESYSYRYSREWEQQPETNPSILFGSGALVSTANDLSKFIHGLFSGKIISAVSLKLMTEKTLGMDTFTYNGKRAYGHTGGIDGFGSWLAYIPEEKLALSYATNGKVYPVTNIMDGVFNIYFNQPFVIPGFEGVTISTEVLNSYTGVYSSTEFPVKVTITREGQVLFFQPNTQPAAPLEATATDIFKIESAGIVIKFDAGKKQLSMTRRNGPERILSKEN